MKHKLFHVDTNLLNAKQRLEEMNELERIADLGEIFLNWSSTAHFEALNNNSQTLKKKANRHIYTINEHEENYPITESKYKQEIFKIMGVNSKSSINDINDALIVCEAQKYGAVLITRDGGSNSQKLGILGRREELAKFVKIVTPSEALKMVK
jgi:hypothetical protein